MATAKKGTAKKPGSVKKPARKQNKGKGKIKGYDPVLLADLCRIHCTDKEIAYLLKVDQDTITNWKQTDKVFARIYNEARADGSQTLRRKQVELATAGNPTMLIWLGKQLLEQREVRSLEISKKDDDLDMLLDEASKDLFKPVKATGSKTKKGA